MDHEGETHDTGEILKRHLGERPKNTRHKDGRKSTKESK